MYCKYCGHEVINTPNFCTFCGKPNPISKHLTTLSNNKASHKITHLKQKTCIAISLCAAILLILTTLGIFFFANNQHIVIQVKNILKEDLESSVEIKKIYYSKDEEGCLVEFRTRKGSDTAAVHLDTGDIEYLSDYEYYTEKAEKARKQGYSESTIHKYNQKVLSYSDLVDWQFALKLQNITEEEYGWERIK